MPTINRRTPPTGTTGTTSTTATTATTGTPPADGSANAQPAEIRSASGQIIQPRAVAVNGLQSVTMNATGATNRFSRDTSFDTYTATGDGPVTRGYIRPEASAIPGGMRLNVKSFHKEKNSKVTLYLIAEVLDQKTNQLRTITLSVLTNNEDLCGSGYRGDHYFDIKYDDVNKFLQAKNPSLKLTPGHTTLGVAARWSNGHQAGGFGRGGTFRVPLQSGAQSVVSVRGAQASNDEADLPLDMQVAYPQKLVAAVPALKTDGNIVSRLESEYKGEAPKAEMTSAVTRMYDLAAKAERGDTRELQQVLGKDWTIETVNRYWIKDDGSSTEGTAGTGYFKGFRVDSDGLPIQDPMKDQYMDDPNMRMTRHEGAIRLRKNKQATVINVKPGGGRGDDRTGIRQRVEVGIELKPGSSTQDAGNTLRGLATNRQWSGTVFNHAQKQVHELDGQLNLQSALDPWLDVVQDRHKFTIKNEKTGVEIEFSFDKVNCKTLRPNLAEADGSPREVEFFVLEAELDHLQLASSNANNYVAGNTTSSSTFSNDSQQDAWLTATSPQVTMDIEPRLHELDDLQNKSFRQTASYKQFEGANGALIPFLFPNGLVPGRQKAAAAAEKLGLVHFDDKSLTEGIQKHIEASGFVWTPELKTSVETAIADPAKKANIDIALVNGTAKNIATFLQSTVGADVSKLQYDLPKVKTRIKDRLSELGFDSTPEIEAMFDKLTAANIPPASFEQFFTRMASQADATVMSQYAQKLGVSPVPAPKPNTTKLFAGAQGQLLGQKLDAAMVDPKQQKEIEKFFADTLQNGGSIQEIRNNINSMQSNPQNRLTTLGNSRQLQASVPTLRANPKKLVETANQQMRAQYLSVGPEMKKFLGEIAKQRPLQEAVNFVNTLRSNAETNIKAEAQRLNISPPKLDWDFGAIHTYLTPQLTNQKVQFSDEMKDFIKAAVEAGVPPAQLTKGFQQLGNNPDMQTAMRAAGVYLAGVPFPEVHYDIAATETYVQQRLNTWAQAFAQGPEFTQYIKDGVKAGLTPNQLYNYAYQDAYRGRAQAARYAPGVPASSIPRLPIDSKQLIAHWKTRLTTQLDAAKEKYLEDALPKAVQSDQFVLQNLYGQNINNIMSRVAQWSGVARPQGV